MRLAPFALLLLAAACTSEAPSPKPVSAASASGAAATPAAAGSALAQLRDAELSRNQAGVGLEHLAHRDPAVRRSAARALARIGAEAGRERLLQALLDDDAEVVSWAAYGLGFACKGNEDATLSAVAARLATAPDKDGWLPAKKACVRAVGRCGGATAEELLRRWLTLPAPLPEDAALALMELARKTKALREETLVELLRVAEGALGSPATPAALSPFTRVDNLSPAVKKRLGEVAAARLAKPSPHRIAAIRALARTGEGAREPLRKLLDDGSATIGERSEAASALGLLGGSAAMLLDWAVAHAPSMDAAGVAALVGATFGVELAVLRAVTELPKGTKRGELERLATLEPPKGVAAAALRRISNLRCEAARLATRSNPIDPLFASCDLQPPNTPGGSVGLRLRVASLDGAPIEGARLDLYRSIASGPDVRAREAALALLVQHGEVDGAASLLAAALAAKEPGVVGAAAEVLATRPERAAELPPKPKAKKKKKKRDELVDEPKPAPAVTSKTVVKALLDALETVTDVEASLALLDAAAALGLERARSKVEAACASPWPVTRERARAALRALGKKDAECPAPAKSPPPPEALRLATSVVNVELDTDVGKLRLSLDPSQAPAAVTRVVDLAKSGFYDGMVVHRVVPGFVAQLGSPTFDGVGGPPDLPLLRCETSPAPPFEPLAIGMALGGRDTGSSQIYVMLGPGRHLDGLHAWLGTASGPWDALAEGDVVHKAKVE